MTSKVSNSNGDVPMTIVVNGNGTHEFEPDYPGADIPSGGSTISFHELNYEVRISPPDKKCACCSKISKQILHNIDGIFRPGVNAIMGPTGSGKTTLLDVLAGRTEPEGISGHILIDGKRRAKDFKCRTGYVVQDDVVMGTLTVKENFMFSANLRLPKTVGHTEKCKRVDETIQELGLTACADSKVGTAIIRGISGGERKRTNIGMELIISPGILFLDEPTTGLDASTAGAVCSLLHAISRKGRTIIMSIHQPRYAIYRQFDRLHLLAAGNTVFHGEAMEALGYFESIGYVCEEHNNPPDFFLDVVNGDSTALKAVTTTTDGTLRNRKKDSKDNLPVSNGKASTAETASESVTVEPENRRGDRSLAKFLSDTFLESSYAKRVADDLAPIFKQFQESNKDNEKKIKAFLENGEHYTTSFPTQLLYVSQRTLRNLYRNPQASALQIFIAIFISVIVGVIFFQLDNSYPAGLQNRVGCMFFIITNQIFSNLSAVELFINERVIFIHESASGFYRVSAYFFAKVFCDFIPMRLIPLCFFTIITYFMFGFQVDVGKFFIYFLALFLTTTSAAAVCFAVSSSVGIFAVANLCSVLVFVLSMIFGGLLVNIASLPEWLRWLQYLSIVRYCLNTLSINELYGMKFYGSTSGPAGGYVNITISGEYYLTSQGIANGTAWDLWQNIMALGIIATGLMTLAYIQLRRMKKTK